MFLIFQAILMGIVEGITEFLPISSTGHLIITGELIGFPENFKKTFEVGIQLGAILAVVFYYRDKIQQSFLTLRPGQQGFTLWSNMLVAFIPSAIVGLLLDDFIESHFFSSKTVAFAFVFGAILMLLADRFFSNYKQDTLEPLNFKRSLLIGFAQCLSLIPGMSRSASTIMGGMVTGLSVKAAAEFSFFLAIPTMIAATGYSLFKGIGEMDTNQWLALGVGFVVSFIVAILVIQQFLAFLQKHSLRVFAYYRIIVGLLMIVLLYFGIIH